MVSESILIRQFQHENETWKRMLAFMKEENINIKNRLSEIVKNMEKSDADMLERIEYFQSGFVAEDITVRRLIKEADAQDKVLVRDAYEDGGLLKTIKGRQAKIRKEIEKTEKEFNKLKFEFNTYLSEALEKI